MDEEQLKNCLKIDMDIRDWKIVLAIIQKRLYIFKRFKIAYKNVEVMATQKGYHIYIELVENMNAQDKIFYQLVLGSDFKREVFNWNRMKQGLDWNILFLRKYNDKNELVSSETIAENETAQLRLALEQETTEYNNG